MMAGEFMSDEYFRARPWMFDKEGGFKISSLAQDPDNPADWGYDAMTTDGRPPEPVRRKGPRTPQEYVNESREWLEVAEWEAIEHSTRDRAATRALLAIAAALLGLCVQVIEEQPPD